jgi:DNA polymerase epsilon subunit 2
MSEAPTHSEQRNHWKQMCLRAFKIHGLSFKVDALNSLLTYIETRVAENPSIDVEVLLNRILNSIDNQHLNNTFVDTSVLTQILDTEKVIVGLSSESSSQTQEQSTIDDNSLASTMEYFVLVNAFEAPKLVWNAVKKMIERVESPSSLTLHGTAADRLSMSRERFQLLEFRLLRNEAFAPVLLSASTSRHKVTPLESLWGSAHVPHLVFGQLSQIREGQYALEDLKSHVPVDLTRATIGPGLFTEGCVVLAEGVMTREDVFQVTSLKMPPIEPRALTLQRGVSEPPFKSVDRRQRNRIEHYESLHRGNSLVILSDVWLDKAAVFEKLQQLLQTYASSVEVPRVICLLGNFVSDVRMPLSMQLPLFAALGRAVAHSRLAERGVRFVFVPGPQDLVFNSGAVLPRPPLLRVLQDALLQSSGLNSPPHPQSHVFFATSPTRIHYCTKEIVLMREDIVARLHRHCVVRPSACADTDELAAQVVHTLLAQAHLSPLPLSVCPIYWCYDHALRLYPLPDFLILADRCSPYSVRLADCACCNPSSFALDNSLISLRPLHSSEQEQVNFATVK